MVVASATSTTPITDTRDARRRPRPGWRFERALWREGYQAVAGIDEVGRGPLAGPVIAAAVIL
ncbi:MAG: hypothetical protein WEA81_08325, partial [Dehalococcoidia bacterium]